MVHQLDKLVRKQGSAAWAACAFPCFCSIHGRPPLLAALTSARLSCALLTAPNSDVRDCRSVFCLQDKTYGSRNCVIQYNAAAQCCSTPINVHQACCCMHNRAAVLHQLNHARSLVGQMWWCCSSLCVMPCRACTLRCHQQGCSDCMGLTG